MYKPQFQKQYSASVDDHAEDLCSKMKYPHGGRNKPEPELISSNENGYFRTWNRTLYISTSECEILHFFVSSQITTNTHTHTDTGLCDTIVSRLSATNGRTSTCSAWRWGHWDALDRHSGAYPRSNIFLQCDKKQKKKQTNKKSLKSAFQ